MLPEAYGLTPTARTYVADRGAMKARRGGAWSGREGRGDRKEGRG